MVLGKLKKKLSGNSDTDINALKERFSQLNQGGAQDPNAAPGAQQQNFQNNSAPAPFSNNVMQNPGVQQGQGAQQQSFQNNSAPMNNHAQAGGFGNGKQPSAQQNMGPGGAPNMQQGFNAQGNQHQSPQGGFNQPNNPQISANQHAANPSAVGQPGAQQGQSGNALGQGASQNSMHTGGQNQQGVQPAASHQTPGGPGQNAASGQQASPGANQHPSNNQGHAPQNAATQANNPHGSTTAQPAGNPPGASHNQPPHEALGNFAAGHTSQPATANLHQPSLGQTHGQTATRQHAASGSNADAAPANQHSAATNTQPGHQVSSGGNQSKSPLDALSSVNVVEVEGHGDNVINDVKVNPATAPSDAEDEFAPGKDPVEESLEELKEEYDDAKLNSVIIEQVKELIEIDNNLNTKIEDVRADLKKEIAERKKLKVEMDKRHTELKELEKSIEKFIALYELVTNQFNPFVKQDDPQTQQKMKDLVGQMNSVGSPAQGQQAASAPAIQNGAPSSASNSARVAPDSQRFLTNAGGSIGTVKELAAFLKTIDSDEFSHHVTAVKNDFASWVEGALGDGALASKIAPIKDPLAMAGILEQAH